MKKSIIFLSLAVFSLASCFDRSQVATRSESQKNSQEKKTDGHEGYDGGYTLVIPDGGPMIDGLNTEEAICGEATFPLSLKPTELLLVLDRSKSMLGKLAGSDRTKWVDMTTALDDTLRATQDKIAWALEMYPEPYGCQVANAFDVGISIKNHDQIMTAIGMGANDTAQTGTPTAKAMNMAVANLKSAGGTGAGGTGAGGTGAGGTGAGGTGAGGTGATKYILLATDGQPNCQNDNDSIKDDLGAIASIEAAALAGYKTFVIGIAIDSVSIGTLSAMAEAGKMARSSEPKYYPVESKNDLASALGLITSAIASCTFRLQNAPPVPENVAVSIGETRITKDPTNGWKYVGGGYLTIELNGSACALYKSGSGEVNMTFGCPGKVIN